MSVAKQTDRDADSLASHLAAIVDDSEDAILSKSLEGTIVSWNRAAQDLYGYSADEVIGRSVSVLVPEDRADEVSRFLDAVKRNQRIDSYETVRLDKWGKRLSVSLTVSPIKGSDGSVVGASITVRDVAARKRADQELAAARDHAVEASRLKSEFVATMSHEIRTPLNGVIGMTHLLLDTDLRPEQREYAETIRISGEVLLSLISDILDFSKIESGKMELVDVDFDVRDTVEEAAQLLSERAHAKDLRLATLIEPDVPTGVRGDPDRLRQVLVNFLGNAVKFTDEGEIVVRASVAEKGQHSVLLSFEVNDTGIGIPPDVQTRLFKIFSQADASSTRKYGGTGLGLAISRQLVELMGGNIGVESKEGEGSRFWFTVRLSNSSREFISPPAPSARLAGVRILVVGDDATSRSFYEQTLRSWGMRPALAQSGEQALTMLRDAATEGEPYVVTLLDLESSEMDDMSLAQEIKGDPAIEGVRVALITSSKQSGEAEASAAVSLTMPVRRASLHDRVVEIVEPGRSRDPGDMAADHPPTEQAKTSPPLVLVVEDNPVNQKVAIRMLENLGFRGDIAANGREAVDAVSREPYAAILMDCQMPEMDGYEATRRIREMVGAGSKTPIIAMTADAMEQDEERARAAGMNDYLSKPVRWEQLAAVVNRWVSVNRTADGLEEQPAGERAQDHVIDVDVLASLQRLEVQGKDIGPGDLVKEFTETAASTLEDLRRFVGRGDGKGTAFAAHRLKGSVGPLGARRMVDMCAEMERLAGEKELSGAADILARIEQEFDRVALAIGADFVQLPRP